MTKSKKGSERSIDPSLLLNDYWLAVLNEVIHKEDPNYHFNYTTVGQYCPPELCDLNATYDRENMQSYYLDRYPDVYLTKREAECIYLCLQGKKNREVAETLSLSPRTIEFYIKNVKTKLQCLSKKEMLTAISKTNFLEDYKTLH